MWAGRWVGEGVPEPAMLPSEVISTSDECREAGFCARSNGRSWAISPDPLTPALVRTVLLVLDLGLSPCYPSFFLSFMAGACPGTCLSGTVLSLSALRSASREPIGTKRCLSLWSKIPALTACRCREWMDASDSSGGAVSSCGCCWAESTMRLWTDRGAYPPVWGEAPGEKEAHGEFLVRARMHAAHQAGKRSYRRGRWAKGRRIGTFRSCRDHAR